MTVKNYNITSSLENIERLLKEEKNISPSLKAAIEVLTIIIKLLIERLNLNSGNSSKPPSQDPNRDKKSKKGSSSKKPGGQKGRTGTTLMPVDDPDEIVNIPVDKSQILPGSYTEEKYVARQVVDILISKHVIEYRAQVLKDKLGNIITATFPDGVDNQVQYGHQIKAQSVYLSMFQLIPYERVVEFFNDQAGIPISKGSIVNFNQKAFNLLESYDRFAKTKLQNSQVMNADETGINVGGKRIWLHSASNESWTHFYPHQKRGSEAIDEIGIIPSFNGVLVHDHWKPYFNYSCEHALCNAHHLRELEYASEQDKQHWAADMQKLLVEMNDTVHSQNDILSCEQIISLEKKYDGIIEKGMLECPPPKPSPIKKRGKIKKSKSRNLLERLKEFKTETLRFLHNQFVPFTNNQGENDLRMTKVQQKISGCFRSLDGAKVFCRIRGYLTTCRKNGVSASDALNKLFMGDLPDFITHDPLWPE